MYDMNLDEEKSVLELSIDCNLTEDELRHMLRELRHFRQRIKKDYKLLVVLPDDLRPSNIDENEKIDLSVYLAKLKGLRQVVLQTGDKNSTSVMRLKQIYSELNIKVNVTSSTYESHKKLGLIE